MGEDYERALLAGIVAKELRLPNGLVGRQRTVHISPGVIDHIARQHADELIYCLRHMESVLANPEYLGHRPRTDQRRVEFVSRAGDRQRLVLLAVKFLDEHDEAWVSTSHFITERYLTRRLRAGTMQKADRGP